MQIYDYFTKTPSFSQKIFQEVYNKIICSLRARRYNTAKKSQFYCDKTIIASPLWARASLTIQNPWQSYSAASYIPCPMRGKGLGKSGGALLMKEGRGGWEKKLFDLKQRKKLQVGIIPFFQKQINELFNFQYENLRKINFIQNFKMSIITDNTTCASYKCTIHKLIVIFICLYQMHLIIGCYKFHIRLAQYYRNNSSTIFLICKKYVNAHFPILQLYQA